MKRCLIAIATSLATIGMVGCTTPSSNKKQKKEKPREVRHALKRKQQANVQPEKIKSYYDHASWVVSTDFLYWRANAGWFAFNTNLVLSTDVGGNPKEFFDITGVSRDYKYEWKPGFRLGIGNYAKGFSQWDTFLNWTCYYDKAKGKTDVSATIPPTGGLSFSADVKSSTAWSMNYNVIDLEVGHNFGFKKKLALRPHFGFRGALIHQDYKSMLGPIDLDISTLNIPFSFDLEAKAGNDFNAFGIRTGAKLLWNLSPHYGIIGQFSGSALLAAFDLKLNTLLDFEAPGILILTGNTNAHENYFRVRTNLEGLIGLYMKWPVYHKRHLLEFTLGYEMSVWFKQNELSTLLSKSSGLLNLSTSTLFSSATAINQLFPQDSRHLALSGLTYNMRYSF